MSPNILIARNLLCFLCSLLLAACSYLPHASNPMEMTWHHSKNHSSRKLLILLPGIWDNPADFENHGFIDIARKNRLAHDFLLVDANIAYLIRGNFSERFTADIITPAREKGYESFWLIGISLGGYNSLSYYLDHPEAIDGVVLLSPYTGVNKKQNLFHRMRKYIDSDDLSSVSERIPYMNWESLAAFEEHNSLENIYLAYGRQDDFAPGYSEFEQLLPPENIYAVDGGHDWQTWSTLWNDLLEMNIIKPLQSTASNMP